MERHLTNLVSELNPLISQNKLFLGAFRRMGLNMWVHFYHVIDDSIKLIDVIMFDIAEEAPQDEIMNPTNLHRVLSVEIFDENLDPSHADLHGMETAIIQLEESGAVKERKVYFSDIAFHVAVKPVHRGPVQQYHS